MARLQKERSASEADNRHLRLELETLRSPQRIEALATHDLHLVAPSQMEAVVLELVREAATPARSLVARR
jgi:cell division protein FtsL